MIWFVVGFILGLLVMKYIENKTFKEKVNTALKNMFKKK
jgi:uncharacterized membrane-anchored protein YhcB (DUF1043 family)